ncbi:MAG: DNA alkylation repair protein [Pseudonocardia sp.]|nr:DNA alkylation repair protein [Pseudonocardia sp.]
MAEPPFARRFLADLRERATPEQAERYRLAFRHAEDDEFLGVPMGEVFALAKASADADLAEIEELLESPVHEMRVGAVSVMDFQARGRRTPADRRRELFELYLRRHDRIDNWDLVDRSAPHVVGGYLLDRPRDVLYELARSGVVWERRTAIVATDVFIRRGDLDDTYRIAELLLGDEHDLIHKAVGGWVRAAGAKDGPRLLRFLDEHAAAMPRTTLRYAIEHLDPDRRAHYRGLPRGRDRA